MTDETNETSATASSSSQPPPLETSLPDRKEIHMEENEDTSTEIVPDETMTDGNFIMSGAATNAQNKPYTGVSQMEAADVESELRNLLTIDDQIPSPSVTTDPSVNSEPVVTTSTQNLADN